MNEVTVTILGEPASKANSRRLVRWGNRIASIKGRKAQGYVQMFQKQCPILDPLLSGDLKMTLHIYYASRRPDLDDSLILDAAQGFLYTNDRQIKERHLFWHLDKTNPRCLITVSNLPEET